MRKILGVLGVLILVLAVTGTATGTIDRLIRGSDVKNGTLTWRDIAHDSIGHGRIANRSLTWRELAPRSIGPGRLAEGAIRLLVAQRLTETNDSFGGIRVVDVPGVPASSGQPQAPSDGVSLYPPVNLAAGKYLVQGSVIFFDFTAGETNNAGVEYGVSQVFLNGTPLLVGTNWSPDIPDDGNNGATASGSFILDVPSGGGTLALKAVIRTTETLMTPAAGQAGGNLIVTRLAAP